MASPQLDKFLQSMRVTYMQWHDGEGYDLAALASLTGDEKDEAERILIVRRALDWRDVAALDALGTSSALDRIERELRAKDIVTRVVATERLHARGRLDAAKVEAIILAALDATTLLNGMTHVLTLAQKHPSPAVKKKVLWKALKGNDDLRVHAAALAHHLHGGTAEPFDWNFRPLYLRFGSRSKTERKQAFDELCALIGVSPESTNE